MTTAEAVNQTQNRFPDFTDITTVDGVAIYVWELHDGSVLEIRVDRRTTGVLSRRLYDENTEVAWCYRHLTAAH